MCITKYLLLPILSLNLSLCSASKTLQPSSNIPTDTIIVTESGPVRGSKILAYDDKYVVRYLGIPYARPPMGSLRFKSPQPVERWTDVFNATNLPKSCPQKDLPFYQILPALKRLSPITEKSEDCLALNIWKPMDSDFGDILVFIHGGGFTHGSSSSEVYNGAALAAKSGMLVITLNYRLASFGYLFLDHKDAPGNMGLMDQRLALQWIRDNARKFGGDPGKVTIWGHSSGAASIAHHMMSPGSQGLFSKAVLLSGASTSAWSYGEREEVKNLSETMLRKTGCYRVGYDWRLDKELSISCLRDLPIEYVLSGEPNKGYDDMFVFKPVADGQFIPRTPKTLLEAGAFQKIDTLFGLVQDEGSIFLPGQLPQLFNVWGSWNPRVPQCSIEQCAETVCMTTDKTELQAIVKQYNNFEDPYNDTLNARKVLELMGDSYFTCTLNEMAQYVAATGRNVYKYLFVHRASNSLWPEWMGVAHSDDLAFFFGEPLSKRGSYTDAEVTLSMHMMNSLASFAKNGNPNYPETDDVLWPKYTTTGKEYLVLSTQNSTIGKRYQERNCYFWNNYLPTLKGRS